MNTSEKEAAAWELWEKAKAFFMMTLSSEEEKSQSTRHLEMVTSVEKNADEFIVYTSSPSAAEKIRNEYCNRLKGAFMMAAGVMIDLKVEHKLNQMIIVETSHENVSIPSTGGVTQEEQFLSTLPLNDEYTFETFVRGPSNSYAYSAAEGVVKNACSAKASYNPLFIHGDTGLGKTHLMQAIGNEIKRQYPRMRVCYLTSETFLNEYVNSLRNGRIESFRLRYRNIDLLLIDDIQFLAQKKDCQVEFFNTFNALKDQHKQIVMTSDVAPKNLPSIEERLISRFEGGMVQEVESPSPETRLAILKKKVEMSDVKVPDHVLEFIADKIKSHVRAMEGALTRICLAISADPKLVLDYNTLSHILKDHIDKEKTLKLLSIQEIQEACAKKYGVSMNDIMSHERMQSIVTPRQMAMYISRKLTSKGLQEIADAFGKKHATIISGVKSITSRLLVEPELKTILEEILSSFGYQLSDIKD